MAVKVSTAYTATDITNEMNSAPYESGVKQEFDLKSSRF